MQCIARLVAVVFAILLMGCDAEDLDEFASGFYGGYPGAVPYGPVYAPTAYPGPFYPPAATHPGYSTGPNPQRQNIPVGGAPAFKAPISATSGGCTSIMKPMVNPKTTTGEARQPTC